ncbi:MAG: carboxypeptidase-like regulatory domain-containing protein [Candidatus Acidiferrales bacterium]|jgi:protocatechuate 3,4-dioxygenase beta subunit
MKHIRQTLFVLILATLGVTAGTSAKVATGTLAGTVLDAQGKPVADAVVTIQTSDGRQPHATRTDSKGRFEFKRFETGQYDLHAQSNGNFSEWAKRISVHSNKTTSITLRLPPAPSESVVVKP